MQKIRLLALLSIVLLFQISGCDRNQTGTLIPTTPTVRVLTEVYGIMPTRYKSSENTILVSVEVKGIRFIDQTDKLLDPRRIRLVVYFKNVSPNSIVLRRPITYGFLGVNVCLNDIEIMIERKDGTPMNITGNSNYPCGTEHSTQPEVTLQDFLEIKRGGIFSYPIEVVPPGVLIEKIKYAGELPSGTYKLKVQYRNIDIGYSLPLEITPPVSFENSQAELEWYDTHTMVVDLNAWVGEVSSNEVEFTIPE